MKTKFLSPNPFILTVIFVVLTIIIIISFIFYYSGRKEYLRNDYSRELVILTDSKVKRLESWRSERFGDASILSNNTEFTSRIEKYLHGKLKSIEKPFVEAYLDLFVRYYDYDDVFLVDTEMQVKYSSAKKTTRIGKPTQSFIREAAELKKPYFSNLYFSEIYNTVFINIVAPMFLSGKFIGSVVFRLDPNDFLYPYIEERPPGENTSETLMFSVEGDEVVALNELRHKKNSTFNVRSKIDEKNKDVITVKTAMGMYGLNEGVDYRGEKVLADSRKIENSPWFIVSKIDSKELYEPLNDDILKAGIAVSSIMLLFGLSIIWIWSNRKKALQIILLKEETQRLALHKHFEHLVKYANDMIVLSDSDMRIIEANDRALETYGYTKEEIKEITLRNFVTPESHPILESQNMQDTRIKEGLIYETIHKKKDGTTFPVEVSLRMFEAGSDVFYQRIIRDIMERKKAEEDLKKSEEKFSKIFHLSTHAFALTDPEDGTVLEINDGFTDTLGYTPEDITGKKMTETGVWANPQHRLELLDMLKRGMSVRGKETLFMKKNGEEIIGLYNAEIISINDKPVMIGNFADITELKRSEEKFSKLFHFSPFAITLSDPETSVFIDVNEGFTEVTGYSRDDVLGKSALALDLWVNKEDRDFVRNEIEKGSHVAGKEFRLRRKTGEIFVGFFFAGMIKINNRNVMFTSLNDITDLKNAEEEIIKLNRELEQRVLERTHQLEQANKELEAFSYSVSHDLRSPLRSIDGFSLALCEDYRDKIGDDGKDYVERIRNAAKRMDELIDGMLKLSRVTRYELKFEDSDLSEIAKEIADELKVNNPDRKSEFIIDDNIAGFCDPYLLRILLGNLMGNAWKYSSKKDKIIIEFGSFKKADNTVYYVKDNGAGFDMTYYNKLFGAFQRLHTVKEFPGTGIGLATALRIVHRHNGEIWAQSEVEKGAAFFFTLNAKN